MLIALLALAVGGFVAVLTDFLVQAGRRRQRTWGRR
jgi:hypothetical protein